MTGFTAGLVGRTWTGGAVNALGMVLCASGLGLRYWARRSLGRFFTVGVVLQPGHRVVQAGPYRRVRHPGNLAFLLFYLGLPLVVGNWVGLLALTLPVSELFIALTVVEDRRVAHELGAPYRAYQASTDRIVPSIW